MITIFTSITKAKALHPYSYDGITSKVHKKKSMEEENIRDRLIVIF